jgi:hypothetical protein
VHLGQRKAGFGRCGNINWAKRTKCNICNTARPGLNEGGARYVVFTNLYVIIVKVTIMFPTSAIRLYRCHTEGKSLETILKNAKKSCIVLSMWQEGNYMSSCSVHYLVAERVEQEATKNLMRLRLRRPSAGEGN